MAMRQQFDFCAIDEVLRAQDPHYDGYSRMMLIRMLFSSLVDADRLDAEFFTEGNSLRSEHGILTTVKAQLSPQAMQNEQAPAINVIERTAASTRDMIHDCNRHVIDSLCEITAKYARSYFEARGKSSLDVKRCALLRACQRKGADPGVQRGLYTLTAPTGSGKTNASITFALEHAKTQDMDRVIYVIPYTSIIDQTAANFEREFGEDNVLPHYAEAPYMLAERDDLDEQGLKRTFAAENWNAPIVVTTAVQFFESLYSNKTSKCRKLHNIANSVLVFDEAQTLPTQHLRPCVKAILELVNHYGCTAVLCTATQPELLPIIRELEDDEEMEIEEISPFTDEEIAAFRRNTIEFIGERSLAELSDILAGHEQVLCVVNTRKEAQQLYDSLRNDHGLMEGAFCLTTLQCGHDRSALLAAIRKRLLEDEPCRVVATSLIEAGVDVDFPTVYRERTGLDSIVQSAGRCNREGRHDVDASKVYVFSTTDGMVPFLRQSLSALHEIVDIKGVDVNSPGAVHAFFRALFMKRTTGETDHFDEKHILSLHGEKGHEHRKMPFPYIAQQFRMIDTPTEPVYVPVNQEARELCDRLLNGEYSRTLFRRLGKYSVNVWPGDLRVLVGNGKLSVLGDDEDDRVYILQDSELYTTGKGLDVSGMSTTGLFI